MSLQRQFKTQLLATCLATCLITLSACQEEQPTGQPSSAAESISETAAESTATRPAHTQPGVQLSAVSKEGDQELTDDPDSPIAFPQSEDLQNWAKVAPVRTATPSEAGKLLNEDDLVRLIRTFHTKKVATSTYQHVQGRARVLFVEAQEPEDAFGLFSLLAPQEWAFAPDRSIRSEKLKDQVKTVYGWQGRSFVRIRLSGPLSKETNGTLDRILDHLLFFAPSEDPPILVRLLPPEKLARSKIWVVRELKALRLADIHPLQDFELATLGERLQLNGQNLATIAAIETPRDDGRNVIFIVRYATSTAAHHAYENYKKAMETDFIPLDKQTLPFEPKGKYFLGSWTAGPESIQGMLLQLRQTLPE